jgi:hypothetical protein
MVLAPFVNYNMDAIFPFCAEAAQVVSLAVMLAKMQNSNLTAINTPLKKVNLLTFGIGNLSVT